MVSDMARRSSLLVATVVVAVLVHVPSIASACAVCTAGKDEENAFAFLMTTIFMSLMPLAALGTLIFVLWRRIQKLEAEREEAGTPPGTATPQSEIR